MIGRRRLAAGAVVLVLCAQYLVAEAIAASAWQTPYSYSRNFISDLGVTTCVPRGPCSPWGDVMNAGFLLSGALAILSALLLAPLVTRTGWRRLLVALAMLHGMGSIIVGLVHSAPGTPAGTPRLHLLGAYAAIVGGNLALIVAGVGLKQSWIAATFRRFSVLVGFCGLASGLTLVFAKGWPPGLLERGAVDTITLWEIAAGVLLGSVLLRHRRATGSSRIGETEPGSGSPLQNVR